MSKILSWILVVISLAMAIMINTSYIQTGGKFIDFSKWQTLTFWVQITANTFVLTNIYSLRLTDKKERIKKENTYLDEQYEKLFSLKDDIINNNKKETLNVYLSVHTNLIERLELYIYKIEKRLKRAIKYTTKQRIALEHEKYEKYLSAVKLLDFPMIETLDVDVHAISVKHRKATYDTVFDLVDYKTSRPITLNYSEAKETSKKIMISPVKSFMTMFTSIVAFGNILVFSDDWRNAALITAVLIVTGIMKYIGAGEDAKEIVSNKTRSVEKAVDTVKLFNIVSMAQIETMKEIIYNRKQEEEIPKAEEEEEVRTYEQPTAIVYELVEST